MLARRFAAVAALIAMAGAPLDVRGQGRPDTATQMEAQRKALASLASMDGVWRGFAWRLLPSGDKVTFTQTERIGPFLDSTIKVIEGRGYESDGKVAFNALGIISYSPDKGTYTMRSYAMGHAGDFPFTVTADGFSWEIPAGPMTIRYTAVVKNGVWREVGDRYAPDKHPERFFEANLTRIGDSKWPAEGAVPQK